MTSLTVEPTPHWIRAVTSRDPRFDGWVIVGVTSTGIYCRPSCPTPVRPKPANMAFYLTPAAAQADGFRACKRCAPDAVPGSPEWNRRDDLVARTIRAIDDGVVDEFGVEGLANTLHVSSRHLNRVLRAEVGASPLALARARRGRIARDLIRSTTLPFGDIAYASGFESVRQFNGTIREIFALTPTALRRTGSIRPSDGDWVEVSLPYRPPFDSAVLWQWLGAHGAPGVEEIDGTTYRRALHLQGGHAVVELEDDVDEHVVRARFRLASLRDLPVGINRVRRLLDLDADPAVINAVLRDDPVLGHIAAKRPGLRVPGSVASDETLTKTVLHQQVSLASAVGSAARLVMDFGEPLDQPVGGVTHCFPTAEALAVLDPDTLSLPRSRAATIVRLADAVATGELQLGPFATERSRVHDQLVAIKGVGPWTASIIAIKTLGDPDVFCPGDAVLRKVALDVGLDGDEAIEAAAERWRPWRSYAMHHLWADYSNSSSLTKEKR